MAIEVGAMAIELGAMAIELGAMAIEVGAMAAAFAAMILRKVMVAHTATMAPVVGGLNDPFCGST